MNLSVEVSFPGGKRVDARIGETLIQTDQSVKSGGEGSAPEPFMLFLSSIATCAGIYALSFCQSRKLPTDGLCLSMVCRHNEKAKRFDQMTLQLTLPRNFPEHYRDAIVRAVDLCTVKKHIVDPPEFKMEVRYA